MRVELLLDGNRMAVTPLRPDICRALEEELHYVKVVYLAGEQARFARTKVQFVPTDCFHYSKGRLITNSGFLQRVMRTIRRLGHQYKVTDLNPPKHPGRLKADQGALKRTTLRYRQDEVLPKFAKYRRARIGCFTGFGKSFLFPTAVEYWPRAKIDIICPGKDTARDVYETLAENRGGVGLFGGGVHKRGKRIQVYCVSSLHHCRFDADIVLGDEIHEYATDKRLELLARYEKARMYGLSASHEERSDGAHHELEALFGPIIMDVPYAEGVAAGVATPIQVRWLPVIMDEDPCDGQVGAAKERWGIWRNKYRNQIIADAAREYEKEQVLIVCKTVEHMVFLKKLLPDFTLVYAENALKGDERYKYEKWKLIKPDEPVMTSGRRDMLKRQFEKGELRKVIVNSVWNRGVNFHQLEVLIRADGAGSDVMSTQIPGRLSRLYEGKQYGILIDLMDQFNKGLRQKARNREKNYEKKGWKQLYPESKSRFLQGRLFSS